MALPTGRIRGCPEEFSLLTPGHAFLPSCVTAAALLFPLPENCFVSGFSRTSFQAGEQAGLTPLNSIAKLWECWTQHEEGDGGCRAGPPLLAVSQF